MNRKNLTAAVLAGLAGAAGIAATAQAVNLNPDGMGQVLVYPYYTANDGNTTILSVVNTTDNAKAVKVRFLEGFNSREVLDFNLYLSKHDVWVAAIAKADVSAPVVSWETDTFLIIPDDSCTVPYLYEDAQVTLPDGTKAGLQPFLNLAYTGDFSDGGPESDARAAEGHIEMIEMGTIKEDSDTEDAITHQIHEVLDDDDEVVSTFWAPGDCDELVENWTGDLVAADSGMWFKEAILFDDRAPTDIERSSGGLFGGAAVINPGHGSMFSYDARAIQGFDKDEDGLSLHYKPGTIHPSLDDGDQHVAWVFFGVPQNTAVELVYPQTVDAVSAVFMHEFTMNEYTTADIPAEAATEWVVTMPTKSFYADPARLVGDPGLSWIPTGEPACGGWIPGADYPMTKSPHSDEPIDGPGPWPNPGWEDCHYQSIPIIVDPTEGRSPFTELFGEEDCEVVTLITYDRDERTFTPDDETGTFPPVVSPAPPVQPCGTECDDVIFQMCNEVNVLRFGDRSVFGTPDLDGDSLLITVMDEFEDGWGKIDYYFDRDHKDWAGLVGLPVTGFAAYQFENDFVESADGTVKAFYGGLFQHKGNVRRVSD